MNNPDSPTYTLTLNSAQADAVLSSVELLMRARLNQPGWIVEELLDWGAPDPDFFAKRDEAQRHLKLAFDALFRGVDPATIKDAKWYRLYNLYQVLRKAIHDAEFPDVCGVWAYDPVQMTAEPLPKCEWKVTK